MELSESGTFAVGRCAKSWCKELKFKFQHSDMLKLEIFLKKWTSNINLGAISQRNWSRIKANQFPVPLLVSLQQLNQNKEQISVGLGSFFMTIVPVQSLKGEVQDLSLFSFLSRTFLKYPHTSFNWSWKFFYDIVPVLIYTKVKRERRSSRCHSLLLLF